MSDSRRLDLSFLEQASKQFDTSLAEYEAEPQRCAYRDSVVMHFLFTYELAIQAIKRYLELESLKSAAEGSTIGFQTLIRRADALGIVQTGWPGFGRFRDARNAVAHTYDEKRALEVTRMAKEFAEEVRFLLDQLEGRVADGE
jgi:nucleotidyltransferase substrate binding protein (TIGR01987 family)